MNLAAANREDAVKIRKNPLPEIAAVE